MSGIPGMWRRTAQSLGLLLPDGTVAPTIFSETTAAAQRTGAVNLGQGFPDDDAPDEVLEAAREAILGGMNQYPPGRGHTVLLEAISEHVQRFGGLSRDPGSEILVTAGASEALSATLLALIDSPEDEVVVFEPYYDLYAAAVALAGARLRPVPLNRDTFQPDLEALVDAVSDRTRIILVNDPHNPTGAVFSAEVKEQIVRLAQQHDALIVTDEVYEHLVFGDRHIPLATMPGAAERTLTISSAGKTFSVTGWKIGWVHGPAELITAVLTVKQFLTFVNGGPFQPAVAVGLRLPDAFFTSIRDTLAAKHQLLAESLEAAGFIVHPPQAGYFTVADATPLGGADAEAFCRSLPDRAGVAALPISAFVRSAQKPAWSGLVRFAACKQPEVLREAGRRLLALR